MRFCPGVCLSSRHSFLSHGFPVLAVGGLEQSDLVVAGFDALLSAVGITPGDQGCDGPQLGDDDFSRPIGLLARVVVHAAEYALPLSSCHFCL